MWLKPMKRTKIKRILKNQKNKLDFETSFKECSLTNTNKTLRQDMVSLKQTKNLKRIIDVHPVVSTGGGGKIKKTKLYIETFKT